MIRYADENDIDYIYNAQKLDFGEEGLSINSIKNYIDNISKLDTVKIIEIDEKVVGYIIFRDNDIIELLQIYIDKSYRHKGLSKDLIDEMIKIKNNKRILLEVRSKNNIAIELYKKYNFNIINKRLDYYKNPKDNAYIMELK